MLLRLRPSLPAPELDSILRLCRELGYTARFLDEAFELLELEGRGEPEHRTRLTDLPGVAELLDAGDVRELHERAPGAPDTVVRAGEARFGGGAVAVIGGPCSIESKARTLDIARSVRAAGATLLRGGAFKPRTSPYSFQGLGAEGLAILDEVRLEVGIGVVTEVLDPRDVEATARACDMFQIGARSMANHALLREVAGVGKPVLLKRGFSATVRELLLSAECLLAEGCEDVVLCERGVRGFDQATRNLLDVGAIAWLKRRTHLPVIADPSHAAGRSELVRPLARAGLACGADGLMVEVHDAPGEARSDADQALSFEQFAALCEDAAALCRLDGRELCRPGRAREEAAAV